MRTVSVVFVGVSMLVEDYEAQVGYIVTCTNERRKRNFANVVNQKSDGMRRSKGRIEYR